MASRRYLFAKFFSAAEEAVHTLMAPKAAVASESQSVISQAMSKFQEAYTRRMTTTMYLAGTAMCPNLNAAALTDPAAVEKLVVRQLPRASARTVWVGDIVAFTSPLVPAGAETVNSLMVRRVAAVEGTEMVPRSSDERPDDDDGADDFVIPPGHCWVLADNPDLRPPNVIDSRSFGFIPMSNIVGRVVYSGRSATEHGPVTNSPLAQVVDAPVLENEVEPEELFAEIGGSGDGSEGEGTGRGGDGEGRGGDAKRE